jgi:uncharacterized protein YjbJ (UPF0337 family)
LQPHAPLAGDDLIAAEGKAETNSWHHACATLHRELNQQKVKLMNTLQMKGNWHVIKGKLKQKFANLTDDDLRYVEGKEEELLGRLQQRTGKTRQEIERALDECGC